MKNAHTKNAHMNTAAFVHHVNTYAYIYMHMKFSQKAKREAKRK